MEQDGNLLVNIDKIGQGRNSSQMSSGVQAFTTETTTGRKKGKGNSINRETSPKAKSSKTKKKSAMRIAEQNIIEFLAKANY
jgi:hypothetical protein